MKLQSATSKALILALVFALCGAPELAQCQQADTPANEPAPIQGTTVNPAQGPLSPPTAPEAQPPSGSPQGTPHTEIAQPTAPDKNEPLGTAAAEGVPTQGGGASRPAGTAIAPAKQHQTRSLLLKLGAVAAGGIAIGTVAALSRGTGSAPSNNGARAAAAGRR